MPNSLQPMSSSPAAGDAAVAEHPAVTRVRDALGAAGAGGEVVVLGDHARTAAAAAEQLGVVHQEDAGLRLL